MALNFPEIGTRYAGTAGGFIATLMLLGNIVLPTYIIMPLSGGDYKIFFILEGVCMLIFVILAPFIPFVQEKSNKTQ